MNKSKELLTPLDIRVDNRAEKWTWSLSHGIKDSIPVEKQTGVVFEISCKDCEDKYIGETLRSLKTWLAEHQFHTYEGPRFDKSAVAEHATFNKHDIDLLVYYLVRVCTYLYTLYLST